MPLKPPNNVTDAGPCMVGMSEHEVQDIKDGKFLAAWKFLPWVIEHLGVPLMQRPPTPAEEKIEPDPAEMTEEEKKAYDKEQKKKNEERKKKDKEDEEKAKAKEERAKARAIAVEAGENLAELGLEESEEEIKIDDLPLDQLVV